MSSKPIWSLYSHLLTRSNKMSVLWIWYFVVCLLYYRCLDNPPKEKSYDRRGTLPVARRTCSSSQPSIELNSELFRTLQHLHAYSSIFDRATLIVEWEVRFDTLETTFVPQIFKAKDWAEFFGIFIDPMMELVKECFTNTVDLETKLHYLVKGTEFIISLDTIAELLKITRPKNADLTPYDDRTPVIQDILQVLGPAMTSPMLAHP